MNTLAAVVITFNRKDLLRKNLLACNQQTLKPNCIYIIDNNSTDGTEQMIDSIQSSIDYKVIYCKMDRNYGSAGGFHYGMKKAFDDGFEWIMTMDDDGRPLNDNCFELVMGYANELYRYNKFVVVGPWVTFDGLHKSFGPEYSESTIRVIQNKTENTYADFISPYNGTVFSRELITEIGLPFKDYFISGDEVEYTFRCERVGAVKKTVLNALYQHPHPNDSVNIFFGKNIISYEKWNKAKQYFVFRNHYLNFLMYNKRRLAYRIRLNRVISILFYESNKIDKFSIYKKAKKDALKLSHNFSAIEKMNREILTYHN